MVSASLPLLNNAKKLISSCDPKSIPYRRSQLFLNLPLGNMKILWLLFLLQTAFAQPGFGKSYLRNSRLCHQWSCINTKLNLSDSLPPPAEFGDVLRRLLPPGKWQDVVDNVIFKCYNDRPRRYSNTCPGQAIMHCAVDQLIANCPEKSLNKEDGCAPVISSLAGGKIMFTQSRYKDIQKNIPFERRPSWFLNKYFKTSCCNLPELFNTTVLSECGFTAMLQHHEHDFQAKFENQTVLPTQSPGPLPSTTPPYNGESLQFVTFNYFQDAQKHPDALDCCDVSGFIQPSWLQECNFKLNWEGQSRLVIKQDTSVTTAASPTTTSTSSPIIRRDVTMVPQSCEKETCVFNKLSITSPSGTVDIDSFSRLLDNFTNNHPSWISAKARVVTTCLRRAAVDYGAQCEINRILACTFDVLTENCPDAKKNDLCKHSTTQRTCQISSSKYRPKHRRDICILPELVDQGILTECGLNSLSKMEPVTTVVKPKTYKPFASTSKCQDLTQSTSCLMSKMGILNKYGFVDYIKMKERIRHFTSLSDDWSRHADVYMGALNNGPLYREHCDSAKKFLNVVDTMMMTCPGSNKKNTAQCADMFDLIMNARTNFGNVSQEENQRILDHFLHVFSSRQTPKVNRPKHTRKLKETPIYNYGILGDHHAPKVTTIDVKPKTSTTARPPLILFPVYMRVPNTNFAIRRPFYENGVMRSGFPFLNQIAQTHISSSPSTPFTTSTLLNNSAPFITSTPALTSVPLVTSTAFPTSAASFDPTTPALTPQPISTSTYTTSPNYESKFEMIKPE